MRLSFKWHNLTQDSIWTLRVAKCYHFSYSHCHPELCYITNIEFQLSLSDSNLYSSSYLTFCLPRHPHHSSEEISYPLDNSFCPGPLYWSTPGSTVYPVFNINEVLQIVLQSTQFTYSEVMQQGATYFDFLMWTRLCDWSCRLCSSVLQPNWLYKTHYLYQSSNPTI